MLSVIADATAPTELHTDLDQVFGPTNGLQ